MKHQDFPGKFIVIEGLDASGKATQSDLLAARFEEEGENVRQAEFPAYGTDFGRLVRQYLDGELGDKEDLPAEIRSLLYSLDRYQFKKEFVEFLEAGGVLVTDRFSQSNYAFQTAAADEPDALTEWMKSVDSRLPRPDKVCFLDVPPEVAAELMGGRVKDIHEKDISFQKKVYRRYKQLAEQNGWTVIECAVDGEIRSKDAIHEDLWNAVKD